MAVQDAPPIPETADVVIVGAGVAGLYCAYRLLNHARTEGEHLDVVVVDRLNRTGGRLDTDLIKIPAEDGTVKTVRDEEGGMRFNFGMQQLMALNFELGLCDEFVPFPMAPTEPEFGLHYFLRGFAFSNEASDASTWGHLYNLSKDEQGKTPGELLGEIFDKIVDANAGVMVWPTPPAAPTPEDWQTLRLRFEWKGIPLNRWQLWGLLRDLGYSEECITMLSHSLGFEGPFLSLANAGEALQILEDFPQPDFFTFKDGFSTLPDALVARIGELGGRIFLGANIETIETSGDGWCLDVTVAPPGQSSSRFVSGGVTKRITAPKVVLAIASKALADLYSSSTVLNRSPRAEQLWNDIQSVENMRLLKINLYFSEAWWCDRSKVDPPVQFGPSFTDLPINSVYPFYSLDGQTDHRNPAALTIYCDYNNTNFWQGLQNVGPYFDSPLQQEHTDPPQVIFPASVAVVEQALAQIEQLFGVVDIPAPVMTSYRLWGSESDFGHAYHQWALDADDAEVMARLAELAEHLYFCNEAYSDDQGWVNGSLRSADRALRVGFGIEPLPIDPDHTCPPPT